MLEVNKCIFIHIVLFGLQKERNKLYNNNKHWESGVLCNFRDAVDDFGKCLYVICLNVVSCVSFLNIFIVLVTD